MSNAQASDVGIAQGIKSPAANERREWLRAATLADAQKFGLMPSEFEHLKSVLNRTLTILELGFCSALFSEHCSYKSTKVHLRTLPSDGEKVIVGPGENAGVVDIGENQGVAFKIESHNHPSFIEPFQGAATGVGGILRDVFTMGARPIALLNALRFGAPDNAKTPYLLSRAVAGIGFYGNCMGVPTIGGELFFHSAYNGNCLVNAFALGLVDKDKIYLGRASGVGNSVLYVGSKTGRDGIHGATMASEAFDEKSEEKRPTVQVGDPFQEKLLLEACLEVMGSTAVIGIQDMGAAGLTSSSFEMAARADSGVRLHLDLVPQREQAMNPYEIMLSESQERMLLVVERGREQEVIDVFSRWDLDAVKIGEVVPGNSVELYWHGECVADIPVPVLTSAVPQYNWPEAPPADYPARRDFDANSIPEPEDLAEVWLDMLGSPNCCSRKPLYSQYDSTVRTNTVVHPGGDAAVIRIKNREGGSSRPERGVAITLDCNSRYCLIDPRQGTLLSLLEACRNITAVGATPLGISDCLNFGSPQKPEGMWQIAESIRGLGEGARLLNIPVVSGNVSLYNETLGKSVLPTPMLAVVGLIGDASLCVSSFFQAEGDSILVLGETREREIGGSEYLSFYAGIEKGNLPQVDLESEERVAKLVRELIAKRLLRSCHDLSSGGLGIALVEACLGGSEHGESGHGIGASLDISERQNGRKDGLLFAETGARYIVSCSKKDQSAVQQLCQAAGVVVSATGVTGGSKIAVNGVAELDLATAFSVWKSGLKDLIGIGH